MSRIASTFAAIRQDRRAAFIPFIMAGDPDPDASYALLKAMPEAGADIIELGVAFTDPMADGPSIQAAGLRALKAGQTLTGTIEMVRRFRAEGGTTPIILMGYANPIHRRGFESFVSEAAEAGVDGLIVVDLPPEEDGPLRSAAAAAGIDVIRLATPTTDAERLPAVVSGASGFIYYVSVAGVTGRASALETDVAAAISGLRQASSLPIAVGFGIKTPGHAAVFGRLADAVVVGSAIVDRVAAGAEALEKGALDTNSFVIDVAGFVRELAMATRLARKS
ncbi:MAG: tryptophan synthase subunit alpha [Alphaproteobacteria bacterium]|nr:tryptophan synthase subunit alpha [Alphaproteobacteria bacterium]